MSQRRTSTNLNSIDPKTEGKTAISPKTLLPQKIRTVRARHLMLLFSLVAAPLMAQAPANPTPDPTTPNLFYGATPTQGADSPVIVFVHGLKGSATDWWVNNDMYSTAYTNGYNTAFVSMNADNTPNDTSWVQNGATLKGLLIKIATHFNSRFYIVSHSKGGLDAQAAILNAQYTGLDPNIAPLVKGVFMLATPNQGTSLADWAFGPGQTIAQQLGLLGPGLQSLEVATVQAFRAKADLAFSRSSIQFYTFAGNTGTGNPVLQVTAKILSTLTPGPNDGLVPLTSTLLPYAYSMNMGQTNSNHYQMNQGHVSFTVTDGPIQGLEKQVAGFRRILTSGFGDGSNTWAWSMKWFKNKLYVGTGRQVNCVTFAASDVQQGTHTYPPSGAGCPADPKDLKLAAEIWQYTPATRAWVRVFQSPQDIPIGNDSAGQPIMAAEDIGFRGMTIFTESNGTQALYVAGVSAGEVYGSIPPYTFKTFPAPRILRSVDGVTFTPLPHNPGTFLGDISLNSPADHNIFGFRALVAYPPGTTAQRLFATATDYQGVGIIIASDNPSAGNNAWYQVSPPAAQMAVWDIAVFNNRLYAVGGDRSNRQGYFVAYTDAQGPAPYTWTNVITQGANATPGLGTQDALSMQVFNNQLYVGTDRPTEMVRINPNNTWDLVVGDPRMSLQGQKNPVSGIAESFGNQFAGHFWRWTVVPAGRHQGLYMGTWDWSLTLSSIWQLANLAEPDFGTDLMTTTDGIHWTAVTTTGLGDGGNYGTRSLESTPFGTFLGTARLVGGTQVWLDQSILDFNNDKVIDLKDVAVVQAAVGHPSAGPNDPRDLDQDGQITANDVQLIASQCTMLNCATPSLLPPKQLPAPKNLNAATGSTVSLTWNAVPGAVAYRVYRQATTPLLNWFPPQGIPVTVFGITLTIPQDILAGKLNFLCPPGGASQNPICSLVYVIEQSAQPNSTVGFPSPLALAARTTTTAFTEAPPTPLQSIYFVRAEDASGLLSEPSNIVGAPSQVQ